MFDSKSTLTVISYLRVIEKIIIESAVKIRTRKVSALINDLRLFA